MTKKILGGLVILSVFIFMFMGCDKTVDMPLPPAVQPPPVQVPPVGLPVGVAPVGVPPVGVPPVGMPPVGTPPGVVPPVGMPPVAVAPATPPPPETELYPIEGEEPEAKKGVVGTGVCKLKGPETKGDELLGNYQCVIDTKDFPFGLKPPPFGCRVASVGDGVKLMPQGQRNGMRMTETKLTGFKLDGKYTFSGQKLSINTCMRARGPGKYKGSGNGVLNGDKKNRIKYTLSMTRQ